MKFSMHLSSHLSFVLEQQFPNSPLKNATLTLIGIFLAFNLLLAFSFVIVAISTPFFSGGMVALKIFTKPIKR